jgi:Fe-S-cluster containining protein
VTGREPYLTSIELLAVERAVATGGGPLSRKRRALPLAGNSSESERTCPLLADNGRCSIYAARPFGCRTFFCERAESLAPVRHADMLARVRQLKSVAEQHQPGGSEGRPLTRALGLGKSR